MTPEQRRRRLVRLLATAALRVATVSDVGGHQSNQVRDQTKTGPAGRNDEKRDGR